MRIACAAFALLLAAFPALAQNVKITPIGSHPGELCANDRAIILAQHRQPGSDVIGVAHSRFDCERSAQIGRRNFGDQFFESIFRRTEGPGEIAIESRGMTCRVSLMPISA